MISILRHQYFPQLSNALGCISASPCTCCTRQFVPTQTTEEAGKCFSLLAACGQWRFCILGSLLEFTRLSSLPRLKPPYKDGQKLLYPHPRAGGCGRGLPVGTRGLAARLRIEFWAAAEAVTLSQQSCPPYNYTNDKIFEKGKSSAFPEAEYLLPAKEQKRLAVISVHLLSSLNAKHATRTTTACYHATDSLNTTTSAAPGAHFAAPPEPTAEEPSSSSSSSSSTAC